MTRCSWLSLLITLTLVGCSRTTEEQTVPTYDAATFFETTSITGASFSADESQILMSSDETGIYNVYAQPYAGGDPQQLTRSTTNANLSVSWFPEDDRFLFTADEGGNELNHLFVQSPAGEVTDLTPGENLKAMFAGWSKDHRHFWVMTNERDPQFFDVYRYSTTDYERSLVFQNDEGWMPAGGSDGAVGRNTVVRRSGKEEIVPGSARISLAAGDRLRIETPGGGGYGTPR